MGILLRIRSLSLDAANAVRSEVSFKSVKLVWEAFREDFDLVDYIQQYGDSTFEIPRLPEEENKLESHITLGGQGAKAKNGREKISKSALLRKTLDKGIGSKPENTSNQMEEEFEEMIMWFLDCEQRTEEEFNGDCTISIDEAI